MKFVSRGVTAHKRWSESLLSQYCSGNGFKALCHESHAQNLIGNRQSLKNKQKNKKNPCSSWSPQTLVLISMSNQLLELHGLLFPRTEDKHGSWASKVCSCPWYWSVPPLPCPKLMKVYVSISCLLKEDSPSQYSNFCGDGWEHVATLLRDLCEVHCNSRKDLLVIHSARDSKRHGHSTWKSFYFWGTGTA